MTADLPEWVDGPKFAEWLFSERPRLLEELSESQARNLNRWMETGVKAGIETVDRICVHLDLHVDLIPDDVWYRGPIRRPRIAAEKREAALELFADGVGITEVSRRLQIGYRTASTWKKDAA